MTPQERDLISKVANRLRQAGPQTKDPEADQWISDQVASQADAVYLLTQAVIVQEYGLQQSQERITALEQELALARQQREAAPPTGGGSFLGGLFGGSTTGKSPGAAAPGTPASRPVAARNRQSNTASTTANGGSGMGDFMRSAAAMAVGVAGGHMLFNGLQGLFGDESTAADGQGLAGSSETGAEQAAEPAASSGGWGSDSGSSQDAVAGGSGGWTQEPDTSGESWGGGNELADDAAADELDIGGFGDDEWG